MQDVLHVRPGIIRRLYAISDCTIRTHLFISKAIHTLIARPLQGVPSVQHHICSAKAIVRLQSTHNDRARNIVVDDLAATLEAHRSRHRAPTLRYYVAGPSGDGYGLHGPLQSQGGDAIANGPLARDEKTLLCRSEVLLDRPADSVPAAEVDTENFEVMTSPVQFGLSRTDVLLEYEGMPRDPQNAWKLDTLECEGLARPWLPYMDEKAELPLERLSSEILAFEAYMRLTPAEEVASRLVFTDLKETLEKQCRIELLGSRRTGLATPQSDIDISASFRYCRDYSTRRKPSGGDPARRMNLDLLSHVRNKLSKSDSFQSILLIRGRIPIICAKHIATCLDVQVQGPIKFDVKREMIEDYIRELPYLRPLYIAIRHCLIMRDLAASSKGGLGAYTLLMMIVRALKSSETDLVLLTPAEQFLHVLKFWSSCDTYHYGYSVDPPATFEKKGIEQDRSTENTSITDASDPQLLGLASIQTIQPLRPYLLCLQDPADHLNDLGKNADDIKHVQQTLLTIRDRMIHPTGFKRPLAKDFHWQTSLLAVALQANYLHFEHQRSRVEQSALPKADKKPDFSQERLISDQAERAKNFKKRAQQANDFRKHRQQEELIRRYQMPSVSTYGYHDTKIE